MVSFIMEPRTRVNAATLSQQMGRPVILLGSIEQVDPSGQMIQVKASDGNLVVVSMEQPLQENLDGIVEFHGISQGKRILAKSYINFPDEFSSRFDMNLYNEAIKLIHTIDPNPWKFD